ncbi:MAG: hydantoinase/oxoprolinase family protein, partial [Firmicutes bacterium]|nr:hydantoinase/oxoprolinase family protein [Bacillota bacterium]
MGWKIGIDIGGTFTDVVAVGDRGQVVTEKAFTTPEDPAQGVLQALEQLARRLGEDLGKLLAAAERVAHGTTISTNALIQRKGAKVGL